MEADSIHISRPDISARFNVILERGKGAAQLVWLFGESGQGKTHFLQRYAEEIESTCLRSYAQCSPPLGNQSTTVMRPYQALKDALEDLLTHQANFRRKVKLIKNISLTVLACIPFVGEVAYGIKEIRRDLNEYKRGEREVDFTNFVHEYFSSLAAMAEDIPIVIMIDDCQWIDSSTVQALTHFFSKEEFGSLPISFVLAARLDEMQGSAELLSFHSQFTQAQFATEISLPPFNSDQVREYLTARFPQTQPDSDTLLWFVQKTGGNPFFLQSYIQHLLLESIIGPDGMLKGRLQDYRGLPAEIKLVNNWLMKSLSDEDLHLLLAASVIGYEFSLHELVHLAQLGAIDLIRRLRRIRILYGICEPIGYKFINGKESSVFRFTQHAIHTALYNELTAEEREALHRMTAQYLNDLRLEKSQDPEVLNSLAGALMLHARLGKQPELEYSSIMMKAQNTPEILDDSMILDRLEKLSPELGMSMNEMEDSYRRALRQAPLSTKHVSAGSHSAYNLPEVEPGTLSTYISHVFELIRKKNASEAVASLDEYLGKAAGTKQSVHPVIQILYGLSSHLSGTDFSRARQALADAARNDSYPTYAATAQLCLILFQPGIRDEEVLSLLRSANSYAGKHQRVVHSLIMFIVRASFGDKPEYDELLDRHAFPVSTQQSLSESYPKVAELLAGR